VSDCLDLQDQVLLGGLGEHAPVKRCVRNDNAFPSDSQPSTQGRVDGMYGYVAMCVPSVTCCRGAMCWNVYAAVLGVEIDSIRISV
jgi:hypothetical protein